MIPPKVSDLAGLLLHVVLAVHSVVDHQLTCTLSDMLPVKKIVTKVIHPDVTEFPGLLVLAVQTVHNADEHRLACP